MNKDSLSRAQFSKLSFFIQQNYGIKMPPSKKIMIESRLRRRMNRIGCPSLSKYVDYVFSNEGQQQELTHMIDVVTTNKTDFFREPMHFQMLQKHILPELISGKRRSYIGNINIWSAACSTGEEPYSIAMVLNDYAEQKHSFRFSILASDVSTAVLKKAQSGIYTEHHISGIPTHLKKKFLLKSKNPHPGLVRVKDCIHEKVNFRRINLMSDDYSLQDKMDIIFCRNVLIYFNKEDQAKMIRRFYQNLKPGGYLFIGHSESIFGMGVPFMSIASTVYKKTEDA